MMRSQLEPSRRRRPHAASFSSLLLLCTTGRNRRMTVAEPRSSRSSGASRLTVCDLPVSTRWLFPPPSDRITSMSERKRSCKTRLEGRHPEAIVHPARRSSLT
ncbi:hypothetical protein K456DRAFT_128696 [Colletotrichum gloeosporioides 23]|nr:hypothetical protein K456DRAFT_128696 [Colletotrichum gloeosporioides 23]